VKATALMPIIVLALILGACSAAGSSPSAIFSASASASESASVEPTASPSEEASPQASDSLGELDCSFPVTGAGTVARAQITEVRVGTHPGYDRVVFAFDDGIPAFTLRKTTPPLSMDPSGQPLQVEGNAFWQLVMQGATRVSPSGAETYHGTTDFEAGFPKLTELIEGGDFEAVSTWYFGLESAACVRVLTLADPSRLVIDIEH
jgi:hypothetical protein